MSYDYGEDSLNSTSASDSGIAQLTSLVNESKKSDIKIQELKAALKEEQARNDRLKQQDIPNLMESLGTMEHRTTTGLHVVVERKVRARISDDTRAGALKWLDDHGLGRMVKDEFKLNLTKGQAEQADKLRKVMDDLNVPYTNKKNVHPQTLMALVRERDASGEDVPDELFNIHRYNEAKIK